MGEVEIVRGVRIQRFVGRGNNSILYVEERLSL